MKFSRTIPPDITDTSVIESGIRSHLSACASPTDSEIEFADEVILTNGYDADGNYTITGALSRPPRADYLHPDFNPDSVDTGTHFEYWEGPQ